MGKADRSFCDTKILVWGGRKLTNYKNEFHVKIRLFNEERSSMRVQRVRVSII